MCKKYCVYKHIAPEPASRVYIGKTCQNPLQRWRRGYDGNILFQYAIEKFGKVTVAFEHYILAPNGEEWIPWNKSMSLNDTNYFLFEEACELEAMWIERYDAQDFRHGFNRQSGGDQGFVLSVQAKDYMSEVLVGRYEGDKNPMYGKTHTDIIKRRLSVIAKQRTGAKNGMWGKHHMEETKERNRQAHLGKYDGANILEARVYMQHPILGPRLLEASEAILALSPDICPAFLGYPDDLKLRSCMTLFIEACPEYQIFQDVIDKFFEGEKDALTLKILYRKKDLEK